MKRQIFKIQMPIYGAPLVLIYNKSRSIVSQLPVTKEIKRMMNGHVKAFFYAIHRNKQLEIQAIAPWQEW